ncbi:hypothetical protein EV182_002707, partial [Spiromyces aspiralis]
MSAPAALTSENLQALQDEDLFEYHSDLDTLSSMSSQGSSLLASSDRGDGQPAEPSRAAANKVPTTAAGRHAGSEGQLEDSRAGPNGPQSRRPDGGGTIPSSPLSSLEEQAELLNLGVSPPMGPNNKGPKQLSGNDSEAIAQGSHEHQEPTACIGQKGAERAEETQQDGAETEGNDSEAEEAMMEAKRQEAFKELTQIEIDFAHLRERLFCERLSQLDRERYLLFNSQHPEYQNQIDEITKAHNKRVEKVKLLYSLRVEQRKYAYQFQINSIKYNYSVQRQAARYNMLKEQMDQLHKLKETHRRLENEKNGTTSLASAHSSRFYAKYIMRNQQRPRKQMLKSIAPKLTLSEQDEDLRAMG